MGQTVPGDGPYTAPILFVGEAPGRTEVIKGRPFAGQTGRIVRSALHFAGAEANDTRFTNVLPFNPGKIAAGARDRLVTTNWDNIKPELLRMRPKVIVACGGLALRRLTGMTGIDAVHGCVWRASDLPKYVRIGGELYPTMLPEGALVVACLHPAGIMRSKLQAKKPWVKAVIARAVAYAKGHEQFDPVTPVVVVPGYEELRDAILAADTVVIDTEYDRDTHVPFLVGLTTDKLARTGTVLSFRPDAEMMDAMSSAVSISNPLLVAHNYTAEVESFRKCQWETGDKRWFCTLLAQATLYPDLPVGLMSCAAFYKDDVSAWKDMDHDDPEYNALDVLHTWDVFNYQRVELARKQMVDVFYDEVMPTAPLCAELETQGMQVSKRMQSLMLLKLDVEVEELERAVSDYVTDMFDRRITQPRLQVAELTKRIDGIEATPPCFQGPCPVKGHDTYTGLRKKRFAANPECICAETYEKATPLRETVQTLKAQRVKLQAQVTKWEDKGFRPTNNHDLRWLLYDKDALALPSQKSEEGRLTANADAIQRLGANKKVLAREDAEDIKLLLGKIKRIQHLAKARSTFLLPPVDENHVAHPPYRMWGTGTGRPAGGADEAIKADRGASRYAWNALNIPKKYRRIFVPFGGE